MIPLPLLALAIWLPAEPPTSNADPITEMFRPDWLQRELRQAPPDSMAPLSTPAFVTQRPPRPSGYVQGLLGVTELRVKDMDLSQGSFDEENDTSMPLLGGAVQRTLSGDRVHLGVEGGFLFGWVGNADAVVIGSGSVAVSANNDVFMTELFGGLYADIMLGEKFRLYGGAGGLVDWAHLNFSYNDPVFGYVNLNDDGFGFGVYTRLGFDFPVQSGMRLGFCWRWFESDIDMGGNLGDVEVDGMQYMLTFTKSL